MDIRRLLVYSDNAKALLHETLAAHPDAFDAPFSTVAVYKTIHELVAHMVGAEQRWTIGRLYGEPRPARYEDAPAAALDGLFADWETIRVRTRAFVVAADDAVLTRIIPVTLPQWAAACELTTEEILFHLVNHQAFHTAQISMALQQRQIDPPNFDFVLLRPAVG